MALEPGTRLGPYEVVSPLGAGGMGEVYRARDTKLGRDVALKVLPEAFTADPDRLARFEREAKVLASLNHPHVAQIYGLEEADGQQALVLELIEGPTLADRIAQGPVPLDEALPVAKQIAEALEAAHEQGIIHRDLKPANVKVKPDGTVKVLDFGLAKAFEPEGSDPNASHSPTLTARATQMGVILGTAAYMSPEQARGKPVDKRADIWAFGVVLYEMLTGRRPFVGEDVSLTLAEVMKGEPDWSRLPSETPRPIRRLLRRCLEKPPERRLRDIGDARLEIEEGGSKSGVDPDAASSGGALRPRSRWKGVTAVLLMVLAGAAAGAIVSGSRRDRPAEVVRFTVEVPRRNGWRAGPGAALSPDGRSLAYVSPNASGEDVIWVRPLDTLSARMVEGTEGAHFPFWSPDGRSLGFFADRQLKRIAVTGGTPQALAEAPNGFGGAWSVEDVIVFAPDMRSPLSRVPAQGGDVRPATTLDGKPRHGAHTSPSFLPDGRHFVFTADAPEGKAGVYVGAIDSPRIQLLLPEVSPAVVSRDGHLVFIDHDGLVRARRLDTQRWELTGERVTVAEGAYREPQVNVYTESTSLSLGANGSLAFRHGSSNRKQLTWLDRSGAVHGTVAQEGSYESPVLSPDDSRVAFGRAGNIWVIDLSRGGAEYPLTSGAGRDARAFYPIWSPDGRYVAYTAGPEGSNLLYRTLATGAGQPEVLLDHMATAPFSWSAGHITFFATHPDTADDIYVLTVDGDRAPKPFLQTRTSEHESCLSADGRWMAYATEESGQPEVYLETFPRSDQRWRISPSGGVQPIWRHDGRELFYMSPDGTLMAVPVATEPSFSAGEPRPLFQTNAQVWAARNSYSPTRDGQRFLVNVDPEIRLSRTAVVLNWRETLARR